MSASKSHSPRKPGWLAVAITGVLFAAGGAAGGVYGERTKHNDDMSAQRRAAFEKYLSVAESTDAAKDGSEWEKPLHNAEASLMLRIPKDPALQSQVTALSQAALNGDDDYAALRSRLIAAANGE